MNNLPFARYRLWFAAAAFYNLLWGAAAILQPRLLFNLLGLPIPSPLPIWQVVGMFVLVYAPAYAWAARDPYAHRHLILIATLGKVLGPIGFAWSAASGSLPLAFGWTILFNDLLWWPAFFAFLRAAARQSGGWGALISGH